MCTLDFLRPQVAFQFEPTAEEAESGMKGWTKEVPMLAGSNLRKEMLRQGFSVYDKKTKRFDQPYVQGDCGGEGKREGASSVLIVWCSG